jgi:hypothetical protein
MFFLSVAREAGNSLQPAQKRKTGGIPLRPMNGFGILCA